MRLPWPAELQNGIDFTDSFFIFVLFYYFVSFHPFDAHRPQLTCTGFSVRLSERRWRQNPQTNKHAKKRTRRRIATNPPLRALVRQSSFAGLAISFLPACAARLMPIATSSGATPRFFFQGPRMIIYRTNAEENMADWTSVLSVIVIRQLLYKKKYRGAVRGSGGGRENI